MVELVDTLGSGSSAGNCMGVRVSPSAPNSSPYQSVKVRRALTDFLFSLSAVRPSPLASATFVCISVRAGIPALGPQANTLSPAGYFHAEGLKAGSPCQALSERFTEKN